jgi:hypothetical protein
VDAEQSDDIRGDVSSVAASLDDVYHVSDLVLRVIAPPSAEGSVDIRLEFARGLAIATSPVSLRDIGLAVAGVLAFNSPRSVEETDRVLFALADGDHGAPTIDEE